MTKGHNQGKEQRPDQKNKTKSQHRKLTDQDKKKQDKGGRSSDPDPSEGRKGKNNVS